jgi:hypothetical protein
MVLFPNLFVGREILILEICPTIALCAICGNIHAGRELIPVVKIFSLLDLGKKPSFLDRHYLHHLA